MMSAAAFISMKFAWYSMNLVVLQLRELQQITLLRMIAHPIPCNQLQSFPVLADVLFHNEILGEAFVRIPIFAQTCESRLCHCFSHQTRGVVDKCEYDGDKTLEPTSRDNELACTRKCKNMVVRFIYTLFPRSMFFGDETTLGE